MAWTWSGTEPKRWTICSATGTFAARATDDPVVVLLDIKMPKVDGLEVLRRIRQDSRLRFMPVVILTSSREEGDLLRSYELGVSGYVVKPVDFEAFASAIKQVGMYWAVINEPPPMPVNESGLQPAS